MNGDISASAPNHLSSVDSGHGLDSGAQPLNSRMRNDTNNARQVAGYKWGPDGGDVKF